MEYRLFIWFNCNRRYSAAQRVFGAEQRIGSEGTKSMKKPATFIKEYLHGRWITKHSGVGGDAFFEAHMTRCNGKAILERDETNNVIKAAIQSGKPYMVCRFGATELATIKTFDFELKGKYAAQLERVHTLSGLFPETEETGNRFTKLMLDSIPEADLIGIWPQAFEEYYTRIYGSETLQYTRLRHLEPWVNPENPWTAGLKGKRVLVVHPFTESIAKQYEKRELLYPGTDILPEFDLQLLKSVQTSGGGSDERFPTWFDAYEWMKDEILRREFDVAILGCGAYGFPLAAEIKRAGKQAIHFGGGTQLLFGIMGSRWEKSERITKYINDAWSRPLESEKPANADSVEKACYW